MKILTAQQMYQADQATIKNKPINSVELMENAALQCVTWLLNYLTNKDQVIYIFCGVGNNGGDGLVIARKLIERNFKIFSYIIEFKNKRSDEFEINYERLIKMDHRAKVITNKLEFPDIKEDAIIIDAIFGIGLSRPPSGFVKKIIQQINETRAKIISIDFPSGLFSEKTVKDCDSVIKSNFTLSFQNTKLAFYLPENEPYIGKLELLEIGLDKSFIENLKTDYETIDKKLVKTIYRSRSKYSNKGTFGHSLIIGGSFGKIGAIVLASKAALKIGSGLVTAYIPKCGYSVLQAVNPEVMVEVDDENYLQYFNYKTKTNVVAIGMGLGAHTKTVAGFAKFIKNNNNLLVIDADALNILSRHKELLDFIPVNSILTPHPKEFERLVGTWDNDYEKLDLLLKFSARYNIVVLLKGANTAIAYDNKIYFNTTGNPALATAGSGDVLSGIITGLIAQNYNALNATLLGAYLHGRTSDIAIEKNQTMETFIASDILAYLPYAIKEIV